MEVLTYFGIEYADLGDIPKYYHQQRENDKEYYQFSELHFCYQILKLAIQKGTLNFLYLIFSIEFITAQEERDAIKWIKKLYIDLIVVKEGES